MLAKSLSSRRLHIIQMAASTEQDSAQGSSFIHMRRGAQEPRAAAQFLFGEERVAEGLSLHRLHKSYPFLSTEQTPGQDFAQRPPSSFDVELRDRGPTSLCARSVPVPRIARFGVGAPPCGPNKNVPPCRSPRTIHDNDAWVACIEAGSTGNVTGCRRAVAQRGYPSQSKHPGPNLRLARSVTDP